MQLSTYIKSSTDDSFPNIRWHQTADFGFAPNRRMQKTFMAVAMDLPDETSNGNAYVLRSRALTALESFLWLNGGLPEIKTGTNRDLMVMSLPHNLF